MTSEGGLDESSPYIFLTLRQKTRPDPQCLEVGLMNQTPTFIRNDKVGLMNQAPTLHFLIVEAKNKT